MITGKNETQELIVGLVWCISYRMSDIAVTIRVFYNYFHFLFETCMITGKSYNSYMTLYEIKESCMMGYPGWLYLSSQYDFTKGILTAFPILKYDVAVIR